MIIYLTLALLLIASVGEHLIQRKKNHSRSFLKWLAVLVPLLTILSLFIWIIENIYSDDLKIFKIALTLKEFNITENFQVNVTGLVFCLAHSLLFLVGALLSQNSPFDKNQMNKIYLLYFSLIVLSFTTSLIVFLLVAAISYFTLITATKYNLLSFSEIKDGLFRLRIFKTYHAITALGLIICAIDHIFINTENSPFSKFGTLILMISCFSAVGLFPFHSWVLPFFGRPASNIFLSMFAVEFSFLILSRIFEPFLLGDQLIISITTSAAVVGAVYGTLRFFNDKSLNHIPAYLYIFNLSSVLLLLTYSSIELRPMILIEYLNQILAIVAMFSVCSLFSSRFGLSKTLSPLTFAVRHPELGLCFLISTISLIVISLMADLFKKFSNESSITASYLIALFSVLLLMNIFSNLRLFGILFYYTNPQPQDPAIALNRIEKTTIWALTTIVFILSFHSGTFLNLCTIFNN